MLRAPPICRVSLKKMPSLQRRARCAEFAPGRVSRWERVVVCIKLRGRGPPGQVSPPNGDVKVTMLFVGLKCKLDDRMDDLDDLDDLDDGREALFGVQKSQNM